MEKIRTLLEMKKALEDLRKSWIDCIYAFTSYGVDCNDYISEEYPFTQSFEEINTIDWIDLSLENINKELKGLQK